MVIQNMKPHTIAESPVLPQTKISVKNLIEVVAKLNSEFLFNHTIKRLIQEMSVDIAEQVIAGVKSSKFGVQLDKPTDVANYN